MGTISGEQLTINTMIKKYILAVIAIILAVCVGFFFGKKSAVAPESPVNDVVVGVAL